jgi:hypothetical protein
MPLQACTACALSSSRFIAKDFSIKRWSSNISSSSSSVSRSASSHHMRHAMSNHPAWPSKRPPNCFWIRSPRSTCQSTAGRSWPMVRQQERLLTMVALRWTATRKRGEWCSYCEPYRRVSTLELLCPKRVAARGSTEVGQGSFIVTNAHMAS